MKILKWTALIVIVVAVIATIVNLRRDAIARGIANSILSEQDIAVSDLSVDSLTPNRLELSRLVIESQSGARYEIRELSLSIDGTQIEHVAAESLIVTYERERDTQSMLSTTLQTALDLPLARAGLEASIARVSLPGLPELSDVGWAASEAQQTLSFKIDAISIDVAVRRQNEREHAVTIDAVGNDSDDVLSADIALVRNDQRYSASGQAGIRTNAWLPIIRSLDLLPAGLESLHAELQGPISILFDKDEAGRAVFDAQFGLVDRLTTTYRSENGSLSDVLVTTMDKLGISIDYPSFAWVAHAGAMSTLLTTGGLDDLPTLINELECRTGTHCTMQAVVDAQGVRWNGYDFRTAELTLPLTIDLAEVIRIDIAPAATGKFTGVQTADLSAETVSVISFSGTQLIVEDDFWHCRVDELQLAVERFVSGDDLVASFPVTLSDLDIRDSAQTVNARFLAPPIADAAWSGMAILLPGAAGTTSINDERLTSSLQLEDSRGAVSAGVDVTFDLSTGGGSIALNDALVSFDSASLSDLAPGLPYPLDIVAGNWGSDVDIEWQTNDDVTRYSGTMQFALDGLAGKYDDIAFIGLSTNVSARMDPTDDVDVSPSSLAVRLMDIGLPLENITASYTVDPGNRTVRVNELSIGALGGIFLTGPFAYSATAETNIVPLQAKSIQLQLMVDLLGSDYIEMSGAISGELPVTVSGKKITIEDGRLRSDTPGGVIRYQSEDGTLDAAVPDDSLGLVTRALSNFEFDSLSSEVDYTDAGDLKLQMRLEGVNPDMDATQPIILNLSVENNVPQLLRSLRATRSIEDILESHAAKKAH